MIDLNRCSMPVSIFITRELIYPISDVISPNLRTYLCVFV